MTDKILLGISSCLIGNNVRYNGGNANKKFFTTDWGEIFKYIPICPEVASGFGVPREPIYLESNNNIITVKTVDTKKDVTKNIYSGCEKVLSSLPDISGFVLKKASPSCGVGTVKVYNNKKGILTSKADGKFCELLKIKYPYLPIEDEGRLNDPKLREHFIKRVFLLHQAKVMLKEAKNLLELQSFHRKHKFILRLHSPIGQRRLGKLLCKQEISIEKLKEKYFNLFITLFDKVAKHGQHYSILQRLLKDINKLISKEEKVSLHKNIKLFYKGIMPLVVPIELINQYVLKYDIKILKEQSYLNLYPKELGLVNDF